MPALVVYIGVHDVTGLVYKSSTDYAFYSYPYVYSSEIFSAVYDQTTFYKNVFELFCKQSDIKLSDCEILITGFLEPPKLNMSLKASVPLNELFTKISTYFPILVNNFAILTPDQLFSQKISNVNARRYTNTDEENFYANLSIYPQVVVSDIVSRIDLDTNIFGMIAKSEVKIDKTKPVVFMGSRFNLLHQIHELNYIFIFDFLKNTGIRKIYTDPTNSLILTQMLKSFYDNNASVSPDLIKLGTLISAKNSLECRITSQVGTSQIIELQKDKLFIVPLDKNEKAKLSLKVVGLDVKELVAEGGSLGIIFDTREHKTDLAGDFRNFNSALKALNGVNSI